MVNVLKSVLSIVMIMAIAFGFVGTARAQFACETGKEEICYGDVDFAFANRNLPTQIGSYSTNGGYPELFATAPQYYYQDKCGMENRTSESYAIFAYRPLDAGFYYCPFVNISANQWVAYAQERAHEGYVLSSTPQVGAIAIMNIGPRGHAAVVEEILDNGRIRLSQYNLIPGSYSESIIQARNATFLLSSPKGGKGA